MTGISTTLMGDQIYVGQTYARSGKHGTFILYRSQLLYTRTYPTLFERKDLLETGIVRRMHIDDFVSNDYARMMLSCR